MDRLPIDVAGSCRAYEVVDVFLEAFKDRVEELKRAKLAQGRRYRSNKTIGGTSIRSSNGEDESPGPLSINAEYPLNESPDK